VATRWAAANINQRRTMMAGVLECIVVKPAARRGGHFDPSARFEDPVWRT
jgi:hypothetical protein